MRKPDETPTITKRDIVSRISERTGMKQNEVTDIVHAVLGTITEALAKGERWELRDFGIFEVKQRAQRQGRNPRTGTEVPVPERKVVTYRAGKRMKELVAGNVDSPSGDAPQTESGAAAEAN